MRKAILILAAVVLMASPALADYYGGRMNWTRVADHYQGQGGEFTLLQDGIPQFLHNNAYAAVAKVQDGNATSFQTFCVELGEYIAQPMDLWVSTTYVDGTEGWSHAIYGGVPGSGDNLDPRTAYLYTQFAKGKLSNYVYGAGRAASAGTLQKVIWLIENEIGSLNDSAGGYLLTPAQQTQGNAWLTEAANAGWTGIGSVRILNAYDPVTGAKLAQDQLWIPAPAALGLGAIGLGLVGWLMRRIA